MFTEGRRFASCALLLGLFACSSQNSSPESEEVPIGLLLPFTGSSSATASNLERAALYAADRINEGGGIAGRNVRIVSRDTHSEVGRGTEAARALADDGVVAVIGPESAEIAEAIRPVFEDRDIVFLSPLVGAGAEPSGACAAPWFRLAPSAKVIGEALAKQADDHGIHRLAVLYSSSPYDRALGSAAALRFTKIIQPDGEPPNKITLERQLDPDAQSYASAVEAALAAGAENVLLAASPRAAAILVNEYDALSGHHPQWFLSPLLKTELLVQNVAPQALEGALGVAPGIFEHDEAFPQAFSARWQGDEPLEGAYFYYDAMALLSVALAKVAKDDTLTLSSAVLKAALVTGEPVYWDGLEAGLDRIRHGKAVYYTGLTGPMRLQTCGSRSNGLTTDWTISHGEILTQVQ